MYQELKNVFLFKTLDNEQVADLLVGHQKHQLRAGQRLFGEGEEADRFFIVLSGQLQLSRLIPNIGQELFRTAQTHDVVGLSALLDQQRRSYTADAETSVEVLSLDAKHFQNSMFMNKHLANAILWNIARTQAEQIQTLNEKIELIYTLGGRR